MPYNPFIVLLYISLLLYLMACSTNEAAIDYEPFNYYQPVKLSQRDAKEFLLEHNRTRKWHYLDNLYWSPKLALYAQHWANELKRQGCKMKHRPKYGYFAQKYGENLYWSSPIRWSDGYNEPQALTAKKIVRDWANEIHDYNYSTNQCYSGKICGHYTQIVWRSTQFVGCATARCRDNSQVWVCNYDPAGNYIDERPY